MTTATLTRGQKAAATRKANQAKEAIRLLAEQTMEREHANEQYVTDADGAARWVAQEAAKHTTIESMQARIADEAKMVAFCAETGREGDGGMHQTLIDVLTQASTDLAEAAIMPAAEVVEPTGYQGPMLALRERLKAGAYKKAANGQPSCGDALAQALGVLKPADVIRACIIALAFDANPYTHLNVGQQSMNLRNRVRNALTRGDFGMGVVIEAVEEVQQGE